MRAEQHAASHLDVLPGDPERVEAPGEIEQADQHQKDAEERERRDEIQVVGDDEVDRIAALEVPDVLGVDVVVEPRQEDEDEPVAQVRDDDARDDDEEQPAAEQGRQRMQPMPLAVAERGCCGVGEWRGCSRLGNARRRRGLDDHAYKPVLRVSATSTRVSRSRSAASCLRPGDHDAGGCRGGDQLELRDAETAVERAVRDVDELHPAVRHRDHALPQDAAPEDQVVAPQLIPVARAPGGA